MIKKIDKSKCDICSLRLQGSCPVIDSCFQDVIRLDGERKPYIAYAKDCCGCHCAYYFACQLDCPLGAVEVSVRRQMPAFVGELITLERGK